MKTFRFGAITLMMIAASAQCAIVAISTKTTCTTDMGSVTDPNACNMLGTAGNSSATASVSYSAIGNTLSVKALNSVNSTNGLPFPAGNSASSTSSLSIDMATAGAVRPGFVLVTVPDFFESANRYFSFGSGAGSYTLSNGSTVAVQETCNVGGCLNSAMNTQYSPMAPILLGTEFDFLATIEAQIAGNITNQGVSAGLTPTFQFFEADGVTPVDIVASIPEPGIGLLASVGFGGWLAGLGLRRRLRSV